MFPRPFMCLEIGSPLQWEDGFVFLNSRHICCTVILYDCTSTASSRYGHFGLLQSIYIITEVRQSICPSFSPYFFQTERHRTKLVKDKLRENSGRPANFADKWVGSSRSQFSSPLLPPSEGIGIVTRIQMGTHIIFYCWYGGGGLQNLFCLY
jgi:hypothetical protein